MHRKKLAMVLMAMLLTLATALGAQAGTFVLAGDYLQVGVSNSGGLIDDGFNAGIRIDPFGGGSYTPADFLMPGSPFEFYSIGVNGVSLGTAGYLAGNTFGMNTVNASFGFVQSSSSISFIGASTLLVVQTAHFLENSKIINFTIELQNLGTATLNNVVYARGLDPDQDVYMGGGTFTNNSIAGGVVTAVGPLTNYSIAIQNVGGIAGVPTVQSSWTTDPYNLLIAHNDGNGDYTINMAWDVGTLLPGHSAEIDFQYNIDAPAVPVPPAVWLFGSGLVGLGLLRFRKKA